MPPEMMGPMGQQGGQIAIVDKKKSNTLYVIGWLVCLCFVVSIACVVGLTFKPTKTFTDGQTYGTMNGDWKTKADQNNDTNPEVCKKCALNPMKLYLWSFGIPLLTAFCLAAAWAVFIHLHPKKLRAMGSNIRAGLGGSQIVRGEEAANYNQQMMMNPSADTAAELRAQQQKLYDLNMAAQFQNQGAMLQQQQFGAGGEGWFTFRGPARRRRGGP